MIIKPCAYCGEMPSEGSTIIHKSGKSLCRVAGTVFTPEQWNNRPGEDAARTTALEEERDRFIKKVDGLPELGSGLAGTIERATVLAILGVKHTHEAKYDGHQLLDECKKCGRDLREELHAGGRS